MQGTEYIQLRLYAEDTYFAIADPSDIVNRDKWYVEHFANGPGFSTYEPDSLSTLLDTELRERDTGNAFTDFAVKVLKAPTVYPDAFSGRRPSGTDVDNWLERGKHLVYDALLSVCLMDCA